MTVVRTKRPEMFDSLGVEIEYGGTAVFRPAEGYIGFVTVEHDEDMPNPLEAWDAMGSIYSFSNRHVNFWRSERRWSNGTELYEALDDEFGKDWVLLGYFEHGLCKWHISGEIPPGTAGDYRWDGTRFGGVWVPDQDLTNQVDDMQEDQDLLPEALRDIWRHRQMQVYARQACEVYTKWCNGEVYWYSVEMYQDRPPYDRRDDYRFSAPEFDDSCGGYLGWEELERGVAEALEGCMRSIESEQKGDGE